MQLEISGFSLPLQVLAPYSSITTSISPRKSRACDRTVLATFCLPFRSERHAFVPDSRVNIKTNMWGRLSLPSFFLPVWIPSRLTNRVTFFSPSLDTEKSLLKLHKAFSTRYINWCDSILMKRKVCIDQKALVCVNTH